MSFGCLQIFQDTNEMCSRISAVPFKKKSQKIRALYIANWRILFWLSCTTFLIWHVFRGLEQKSLCWFFGRFEDTKRSFSNQLTFRYLSELTRDWIEYLVDLIIYLSGNFWFWPIFSNKTVMKHKSKVGYLNFSDDFNFFSLKISLLYHTASFCLSLLARTSV